MHTGFFKSAYLYLNISLSLKRLTYCHVLKEKFFLGLIQGEGE